MAGIARRVGAGVLIFVPALALSPVMSEGFRLPKLLSGEILILAAVILASVAVIARRTRIDHVDGAWLVPPLLAAATMWMGGRFAGGPAEVVRLTTLSLAFILFRRLAGPGEVAGWAALALGYNALVAFAQAAGFRSVWWVPWQGRHAVYGTFGNPNFLAEYAAPVLILAAAGCLRARDWARSFLWGAAAFAASVVLMLTVSRGAWLGASAGLGVAVLMGAFRVPFRRGRAIALAGVILVAGLFLWKPVWNRLGSSFSGDEPGLVTRVFMWRAAERVFRTAPVLGAGPAAYASSYLDVSAAMYEEGTPPPPYAGITQEAHSEPLQLLAERGLAGAVVWLMAFGLALSFGRGTGETGASRAAPYGALAAIAVTAFLGFPMHVMPTGILFMALLASMIPLSPKAGDIPGAVVAVPGIALALLLALPAARSLVSATAIGLAREDAVAEAMLGKALVAEPGSGEARFRLGRELIRQGRFDEASGEFEAALAGYRDPDTWFNLGWIALKQGRYGAAETWFREGLRRYPRYKARPWADLATALAGQGRKGEAREAAMRALEIDPGEPTARAIVIGRGGGKR